MMEKAINKQDLMNEISSLIRKHENLREIYIEDGAPSTAWAHGLVTKTLKDVLKKASELKE